MADIRACGLCHELLTEDMAVALAARKQGHALAHPECARLVDSGMVSAFGELMADARDLARCRHRAGTVGGRCLDCGEPGV